MPILKTVLWRKLRQSLRLLPLPISICLWREKHASGETLPDARRGQRLASVVIPMAKAFGLRVITTVLSKKIAESISHLNADRVVDTSTGRDGRGLEGSRRGAGVDIAIDCLGAR